MRAPPEGPAAVADDAPVVSKVLLPRLGLLLAHEADLEVPLMSGAEFTTLYFLRSTQKGPRNWSVCSRQASWVRSGAYLRVEYPIGASLE